MGGVRIDASRIADGISLIDAFREAGFAAALADAPGTWDVEVEGELHAVAPVLLDWTTARGRVLTVAHLDGRTYLVAEPLAALA